MVEASSLLRTVLDSTAEISIIATDPGLTIRVFNAGAERLLGYESAEVVGRQTPIIMHDADELRICAVELSAQLGLEVEDGAVFAKGLVRHSAGVVAEWAGRQSGELPADLVTEVVHRDDLVVLE